MGGDGTDNDVIARFVRQSGTGSCTTPVLNSAANDWSKWDLEEWYGSYLGECDGFYLVDDAEAWNTDLEGEKTEAFTLELSRKGRDSLFVSKVTIEVSIPFQEISKT